LTAKIASITELLQEGAEAIQAGKRMNLGMMTWLSAQLTLELIRLRNTQP
jgi:hypothetical protein